LYFFFPEVKGRSLEEIDELFEARIPARKFRSYKCTGRAAAVKDDFVQDEKSASEVRVEDIHHTTTKERVFSDPKAAAEEATTSIV
jgi:hypothetical protein